MCERHFNAAKLQHPHIVPLLASGESDGNCFYTMPFVAGQSLRDRLRERGQFSIAECVAAMRDIASALGHAHGHGIIHRDVKPENILFSDDIAVVTDFGIAKAIVASTDAQRVAATNLTALGTAIGTAIGTPAYMAPEQVVGDPHLDRRADIYAFGCVAYEMLAGTSPFAGRTTPKTLAAHVSEQPRSLSSLRTDVPAPLEALVMRCLAKDPAGRPDSIIEIRGTLRGLDVAPVRPRVLRRVAALGAGVVVLTLVALLATRSRVHGASIAVLPFSLIGGDTANRWFADGMASGARNDRCRAQEQLTMRGSAAPVSGSAFLLRQRRPAI